jgi:hypothetical protein
MCLSCEDESLLASSQIDRDMLQRVWAEVDYWLHVCCVTKGGHIEHLRGVQKTWREIPLYSPQKPKETIKKSE